LAQFVTVVWTNVGWYSWVTVLAKGARPVKTCMPHCYINSNINSKMFTLGDWPNLETGVGRLGKYRTECVCK